MKVEKFINTLEECAGYTCKHETSEEHWVISRGDLTTLVELVRKEERATLCEMLCAKLEGRKIELSGEPLEDWEGDVGFVNGLTDAQLIIKETLV
jgi:hypothetical protein